MLPWYEQSPSSLRWIAFSSLLPQESWKYVDLALGSVPSPHLQPPPCPEASRFWTWNTNYILVLKSVLKSAKSALLNHIDMVSNTVRTRWVSLLLEKNNNAGFNNGFIFLQPLARVDMQNSHHSTISAHKQVWDDSKMPSFSVLQKFSNEKPNFWKLEMLQCTKPLEGSPVKLSGKGIKSGCIGNSGTYSNEHSIEFLSVDCFKQIVKNLNILSFSTTSSHG